MKTKAKTLGDLGEKAAAKYLRKNRYRIRERNYICGRYEIDIIAEDHDFIVFVEVKTRTYHEESMARFGRACVAVDENKQRCLLLAARDYMLEKKCKKRIRMDIIEVYYWEGEPPLLQTIHHMPDAFR